MVPGGGFVAWSAGQWIALMVAVLAALAAVAIFVFGVVDTERRHRKDAS